MPNCNTTRRRRRYERFIAGTDLGLKGNARGEGTFRFTGGELAIFKFCARK